MASSNDHLIFSSSRGYNTRRNVAMLGLASLVLLLAPVVTTAQILGLSATSLCAELIRPNGYTCNEYTVQTGDGFLLGVQNVPCPRGQSSSTSPRPAVLLQHGLLGAGDNWVLNPPSEGLAFILADAGFDVWIGNNRNVQWSHGNVNYKDTNDPRYWNWTYDELSSFDLEATTKFVYDHTGKNKIFYIGHSQGSLMLIAGLTGGAFKQEVLGYLKAAVLLAPVGSVAHLTGLGARVGFTTYGDALLAKIGIGGFVLNPLLYVPCHVTGNGALCTTTFNLLLGTGSHGNVSRNEFYSNYFPQLTSAHNINHFGQSFRTNTFQFYDRGSVGNQVAYGQPTPPLYDLTTFPTSLPLQIWTGGSDQLADPIDTANLLAKLPSVNRNVITLPDYGHADFVIGVSANVDIYPQVMQFLNSH